MTGHNNQSIINEWLEGIENALCGIGYFLKRGQITKAHLQATFACEYADEISILLTERRIGNE